MFMQTVHVYDRCLKHVLNGHRLQPSASNCVETLTFLQCYFTFFCDNAHNNLRLLPRTLEATLTISKRCLMFVATVTTLNRQNKM
jgi:hypothetical protein